MKSPRFLYSIRLAGSFALALALLSGSTTARANVYATDIKLNSSLSTVTGATGSPITISYILNEAATAGVTVKILSGATTVASFAGTTTRGLNTVTWTPAAAGTYSVSITAAATGYPFWTQTSLDAAGNVAVYAHGVAVDCNSNSPYYGRVFVNNASAATQHGVSQLVGIYKYNADASPADEGSFGYGGYSVNNSGQVGAAGQMAVHGTSGNGERTMRVGTDDNLYMNDFSNDGSVVAFDPLVSTATMVIDQGTSSGNFPNAPNYGGNPDYIDLSNGVNGFDVIPTGTNASVFLCDDDYPGWGVWMYHMTNGTADPNDTEGAQAVATGGDLSLLSSGGCMVDNNLDIFVSQLRSGAGDTAQRTMLFTNWNMGMIAPEAGGFNYATGTVTGEVKWAVGSGDDTMSGIFDTVIDSRAKPKYVAVTLHNGAAVTGGYSGKNGGIRVLNAVDGTVVSVTNGATVQTLTNIDFANWYEGASFDNVGNLYASSTSANYWRVWSPPGANTATTVAVAQAIVTIPFTITSITASPTTPGCANVTIKFTAPANPPSSVFTLLGSAKVNGTYLPVGGAVITGSAGSYQATFTSCSTEFYMIHEHNP